MEEQQKQIIENYIQSYNNFDVAGMLRDLDEDIVFENISNGALTHKTNGLEEFKKQAEVATQYFTQRKHSVVSWEFSGPKVLIKIRYEATLAMDFPNGLKKGRTLALLGTSEFTFDDGKIKRITDNS